MMLTVQNGVSYPSMYEMFTVTTDFTERGVQDIGPFLIIQHCEQTKLTTVFSVVYNVNSNIKRYIVLVQTVSMINRISSFVAPARLSFVMASIVIPRVCTHLYLILQLY